MSKQRSTLLPKTATMSNEFCVEISSFRRCFDIVAQNGNIVEATGNKVACCFDNVASTLLLVWTGFYTVFATKYVPILKLQERGTAARRVGNDCVLSWCVCVRAVDKQCDACIKTARVAVRHERNNNQRLSHAIAVQSLKPLTWYIVDVLRARNSNRRLMGNCIAEHRRHNLLGTQTPAWGLFPVFRHAR